MTLANAVAITGGGRRAYLRASRNASYIRCPSRGLRAAGERQPWRVDSMDRRLLAVRAITRRLVVADRRIVSPSLANQFQLHCANLGVGRCLGFPQDFLAQRQIEPVRFESEVSGDLLVSRAPDRTVDVSLLEKCDRSVLVSRSLSTRRCCALISPHFTSGTGSTPVRVVIRCGALWP